MQTTKLNIPKKMRGEFHRLKRDIEAANQLLDEAFSRQERLAQQAEGSSLANLLAASGVSLAAERLKLLYKREAELDLEIRQAVAAQCDQDEVDSRVTLLFSATA
jgi:hypothetical protein